MEEGGGRFGQRGLMSKGLEEDSGCVLGMEEGRLV